MSLMATPLSQCDSEDSLPEERGPKPRGPLRASHAAAGGLALLLAGLAVAAILARQGRPAVGSASASVALRGLGERQHIWIVRHGDKYSSYPDCPAKPLCYDKDLMGDNPPLTPCGIKQANATAKHLHDVSADFGGIKSIVASPFTRTLQTALPLARALDLAIKVEYLVSEANQPEGPFRELNVKSGEETVGQLKDIGKRWDLGYGSPPIPTPEDPPLYGKRVQKAAKVLKTRFPPSSGNLVIFTHATTSFSIAYGLCHGEDSSDKTVQSFVENQKPIGPAGVIHVVLDGHGKCITVSQTANVAEKVGCGKTEPFKCKFADFPSWYWPHSKGKGPGACH